MIRVLVAEDSVTVRDLLIAILSADPEISIVGVAKDGLEAVLMAGKLRPDVITMDIHMPNLDGFDATKRIMNEVPTPIVIVSSGIARDVEVSLNALRAGAVAVLATPQGPASSQFTSTSEQLVDTVKAMSDVKVVRHWSQPVRVPPPVPRGGEPIRVVAIAASTGGPAAVEHLLSRLPSGFPAAILVVQHIAPGFSEGLASWLNATSPLPVKLAEDGELIVPGRVYVAGEDRHLTVSRGERIILANDPPIGGFRPSATALFRSVAEHFGSSAAGVVLTGMGSDGVDGLLALREAGGCVLAQDEASSIVFGMPAAAIEAGAASIVLPLPQLAPQLTRMVQDKEGRDVPDSGS